MSARPESVDAAVAAVLRHLGYLGWPSLGVADPAAAEAAEFPAGVPVRGVVEVALGTVAQPYERGYTFLELPFQPRIHRDGHLYRVKYGGEVRGGLSYDDAIRVLGKCLMHSLTNSGRLG